MFYNHLLFPGDDPHSDWTLRHGKSAAIFVALKESPSTILTDQYELRLTKTLLTLLSADRVPIVLNAVRACGYLLQYTMNEGLNIPQQILVPFVRVSGIITNRILYFKDMIFLDDES